MNSPVDVTISGAVILGPDVVCDGFFRASKARVQTHIHLDHMSDFESSKGFQDILLSKATRELLCVERDAELRFRSNILVLKEGVAHQINNSKITLTANGHMLGSVQVAVEDGRGMRTGYSGDFQWPLDSVISVDALVVDSTYGKPTDIRKYSQDECESRFLELILTKLAHGPIHLFAHRGTLQRALNILSGNVLSPIVATPRLCREVEVYRAFGYPIQPLLTTDSQEAADQLLTGRFIRLYGTGDKRPVDIGRGACVTLSAYLARPDDPITEYSDRAFGVAMSNHADFLGTLDYVRKTGAKFVVTDNSRGGKGYELAIAIRSKLGIEAQPSSNIESREWGK